MSSWPLTKRASKNNNPILPSRKEFLAPLNTSNSKPLVSIFRTSIFLISLVLENVSTVVVFTRVFFLRLLGSSSCIFKNEFVFE
ncbi:hypothetical protein WNY78_05660 [Psychroserpens sp. AS72]|uniref:hypothetical protein n=1 Tax=Psychroserpens sp. AS72 TaxID=3135775 RepID=UPI003178CDAE